MPEEQILNYAQDKNPIEDPIFISVKQMAVMLNIGRSQAYALLNSGAIESKYIGRRRLVDVTSLRAFADALPDHPRRV